MRELVLIASILGIAATYIVDRNFKLRFREYSE
jgi:hypothetical protein